MKQHQLILPLAGAIALATTTTLPAIGQVIPDNSLGTESSVVVPGENINGIESDRIDGGALRGGNLFHSFQEFNVGDGAGVYFSNPQGIDNIFSRVTGNNISNILGTLGVLGNANLFLLNPNGIFFGPNARLDVGGSFFASTATGILFDGGAEFAATNSQGAPLLTVNIPVGLQFRGNSGTVPEIVNQSGLQVETGETLALVGGDVRLEGGSLRAPGGRVELGGLSGEGVVELGGALGFPEGVGRGDVLMTEGAIVNVRGSDGGSIGVNAGNFEMLADSKVRAGIDEGMGSPESRAGDIDIDATGVVAIDNGVVTNSVETEATGNGGNINVNAGSLAVINGGLLVVRTLGTGNGGSIKIRARDAVVVDGTNGAVGGVSNIAAVVGTNATGEVGGVELEARSLNVTNDAVVAARTQGVGDSGNLVINVSELALSDKGQLFTGVGEGAVGNSGNINITASSMSLTERGSVSAESNGRGNAGNINIATESLTMSGGSQIFASAIADVGNAGDIFIAATGSLFLEGFDKNNITTIGSQVAQEAVGNAGSVSITADSFSAIGQVEISTATLGRGDAGNIDIASRSVAMKDGAQLSSETAGEGNAGQVSIAATDSVELAGVGTLISSSVNETGIGNAGGIFIETERLSLSDRAGLTVDVFGRGQGGNITINTGSMNLSGGATIFANALGIGDGGSININARDTVVLDGENSILASGAIDEEGEGGSVNINADEGIGEGEGGDININASSLAMTNGAVLFVNTVRKGNAGDVKINVSDTVTLDGVEVRSDVEETGTGNGGEIEITAGAVSITSGTRITSRVRGRGNAGSINIDARNVSLEGGSQIQGIVGSTGIGEGGRINIDTDFFSVDDAVVTTAALGEGNNAGNIEVTANSIQLETGRISTETTSGDGGNLILRSDDLILREGSLIATDAGVIGSGGDGGNMTLDAKLLIGLENSNITANAFLGRGGRVDITADGVFGFEILPRAELERRLDTNDLTEFEAGQIPQSIITAISQTDPSLSGTVELNTPEVDPAAGLVELPQEVVDPAALIAADPCRQGDRSEFTVTGKGGLPPDPNQRANSQDARVDLVEPVAPTVGQTSRPSAQQPPLSVQPARGWVRDANGDLILVSYDPTGEGPVRQGEKPPMCR